MGSGKLECMTILPGFRRQTDSNDFCAGIDSGKPGNLGFYNTGKTVR
jgi:hypothetical protein